MKTKLLFICTANVMRSPTAEGLFKHSDEYEAKSAGILIVPEYPNATLINQNLINWADKIFVMSEKEDKHLTFLKENFDLKGKEIFDLDISNIYEKNDPILISLLKEKISKYLPIKF